MSTTPRFNPALPFVKVGYPGNPLRGRRYTNLDDSWPVGFNTVLRWMLSRNPQRTAKKADTFRLPVTIDRHILSTSADAFSWLGHAAFLIRLKDKLLLTDPCMNSLPGVKRLVANPYPFQELPHLDYVLFSHTHRDHYDIASVKALLQAHPNVHFLVPLQMAPLLKAIGAKQITEAGWFQHYNLPEETGLRISFLPARHWNRRFIHDTNRELWGSFMLETPERCIYFAGDTAAGDHFAEIGELFPKIGHVFMPIGAYQPSFMMQGAHIHPDEAVIAFHALGGTHFIPMHHGTYDLSDEPIGEPSRIISEHHTTGRLRGDLIAPAVGETIFF